MYIAAFDPGKKNFAFCVERVEDIEPDSNRKYNVDGTPTEQTKQLLDEVCSNGKVVLYDNVDIADKEDQKIYANLTEELDRHTDIWEKCEYFLIEKQMSFGSKINLPAIKIAQHIYSYFVIRYGMAKKIIEFAAYHKTQVLGAPKVLGKKRYQAMTKPQRKKWAVTKAIEILQLRGEEDIIEIINSRKKRDDLADVFLMCQAFKVKGETP